MADRVIPVFDLGEVLLFVHEDRFLEKLAARCRPGAPVEESFWGHYRRLGVARGGDFGALHPILAEEIGLEMTPEEFLLAWQDMFSPNPPMIALVNQLPRPRYLLSNTNEPHIVWIRRHYPEALEPFDGLVLSHEVGVEKPQVEIYRAVERLSGGPPEQHVFFDDREDNVEGARAAGWRAWTFTGAEQCRAVLEELGR